MARITINGISLDPIVQARALSAAGLESVDASRSDFILIQTAAPLTRPQKDELAALGVVIHESVSPNTVLCGFKGTDLASIRALPFVTWADVYLQQFKVAANLRPAAPARALEVLPMSVATTSRKPRTMDIVFHEGVDTNSDALKSAIAAAAGVGKDGLPMGRNKVRLTVEERRLDELAAIDAVRVIQEVPPVGLHNNVARQILGCGERHHL